MEGWLNTHVLAPDSVIQIGLIALALLFGWLLGPRLRGVVESVSEHRTWRANVRSSIARVAALSGPIIMLVFLWIAVEAGTKTDLFGNYLTRTAASLASAWVVIRLASGLIKHDGLARFIAWTAWILAALTTLGLFDAAVTLLDGMAMSFGQVRISVLTVAKGAMALAVLLWITVSVSNMLERRISRAGSLSPSVQVLTIKLIKIALITVGSLVLINGLGIDLTALAVFGGAVGIGIGFGLQRIIANLVSGLILLMDKSIKPNDVIAVGNTYGWIVSLGARYAAVRTRDGVEHLIPNEELIVQRVENLVA